MGGAHFQTVCVHFLFFVSHVPVEVFIDGVKVWGWDGPHASSYLKCLRFLLPNKQIANTLVSSCAEGVSREGFVLQTGPHNNSGGAEGVG